MPFGNGASNSACKPRQDRRRACRRDEKPRLITDDLGETPMCLVPVEARRRPTCQFEPLRAVDEAALERERFAALDLHRPPGPDHRIDDLLCREGMFVFRSEEHTSELQSLMRISYAVFCLKKKKDKLYQRIL